MVDRSSTSHRKCSSSASAPALDARSGLKTSFDIALSTKLCNLYWLQRLLSAACDAGPFPNFLCVATQSASACPPFARRRRVYDRIRRRRRDSVVQCPEMQAFRVYHLLVWRHCDLQTREPIQSLLKPATMRSSGIRPPIDRRKKDFPAVGLNEVPRQGGALVRHTHVLHNVSFNK